MADTATELYRRMRRQALLTVAAVGLVPLAITSALFFSAAHRGLDSNARAGLEALVLSRKARTEVFVDEKVRQLQFAAATTPAGQLARKDVIERLYREMQKDGGGIVDLGLLDAGGHHLSYVGPYNLTGRDYRSAPWFKKVTRIGTVRTDIFLGLRGFPHMIVAVKKSESKSDYVLRATIDTDALSSLLTPSETLPTAQLFILNRAGEYQTRVASEHRLMTRASVGPVAPHPGVRLTISTRDTPPHYVATTWLRGDSWVLVGRLPVASTWDLLGREPMIPWVLSIVTVTVLLLAVLMARVRGRQLQQLEAHHATQLESFAQGQRMATISRMATAIAHELSGPLTSIGDAAANLSARLGDSDPRPNTRELREHLESIAAQVRRAERVTDGLRHFSRYVHQESESVNVEACLDETLRLVEQGEGSRVRLVRHYAPDVPPIVSNLAQTQQVFLTLINSALDAVGARGEVHVHVIGAGRGVEIRIQDNGPGIPPEQLRHVFEPFSPAQTEPASTRGLGLSLCRDVMQSLGGRIAVASSPGQGTTFSLWFPSEQQG